MAIIALRYERFRHTSLHSASFTPADSGISGERDKRDVRAGGLAAAE